MRPRSPAYASETVDTFRSVILSAAPIDPGLPKTVLDWFSLVGSTATTLGVVVALIALVFTGRQLVETVRARKDAAEGEVERLQPAVAVYIDSPPDRPASPDLVIENFGPTAARDVHVEFATPLRRSGFAAPEEETYRTVQVPDIPFLGPGQQWRTWFDSARGRRDQGDLEDRYEGSVRYSGLHGVTRRDAVVLDFSPLKARIYTEEKTLGSVVHAIEKLTTATKAAQRG